MMRLAAAGGPSPPRGQQAASEPWASCPRQSGLASAVVAVWLAFMTPDPVRAPDSTSTADRAPRAASGWGEVARSPLFWAIVPLPCLTNAVGLAVQGLWAGPWLIDVAKIAPSSIGGLLLLISAGMLVANISLGNVMGRLMRRGVSPVVFCFVCCLFALVGQLAFLFSWHAAPAVAMTLFGLTHVAGNLLFAALFSRFEEVLEIAQRFQDED